MACLFASQKCSDFTASAGETLKCVNVVNKHGLGINFRIQDCLEWSVHDATGIVHAELLH